MNKLACCLEALTILSPMSEVCAKEPSSDSLQERKVCNELRHEKLAALKISDWPAVDRIARHFIQSCSSVDSRKEIADVYGEVAGANNEMGRFEEALVQANAGIAMHYLETSNHLEKVTALTALNKMTEAKESFRVADHVINLAIAEYNTKLQRARFDFEREEYLLMIALCDARLKALDRYRLQLGNP